MFKLINRPVLDASNPNSEDNHLWINSFSYDPDISKLKSIVSDGKGGYKLV
jgi:hypothetical protein